LVLVLVLLRFEIGSVVAAERASSNIFRI